LDFLALKGLNKGYPENLILKGVGSFVGNSNFCEPPSAYNRKKCLVVIYFKYKTFTYIDFVCSAVFDKLVLTTRFT